MFRKIAERLIINFFIMAQKTDKIFPYHTLPDAAVKAIFRCQQIIVTPNVDLIQKIQRRGKRLIKRNCRIGKLVRAGNIPEGIGKRRKIRNIPLTYDVGCTVPFKIIRDQLLHELFHHQRDLGFICRRKVRRDVQLLKIRADEIQTKAVNRADMRGGNK